MFYSLEEKRDTRPHLKYIEHLGSYNTLPKPIEECSSSEYFYHLSLYTPIYIESRLPLVENEFQTIKIFYFYDRAYIISFNNTSPTETKLTFYRVGCIHDYIETENDNCQHTIKCTKCGLEVSYDSSG